MDGVWLVFRIISYIVCNKMNVRLMVSLQYTPLFFFLKSSVTRKCYAITWFMYLDGVIHWSSANYTFMPCKLVNFESNTTTHRGIANLIQSMISCIYSLDKCAVYSGWINLQYGVHIHVGSQISRTYLERACYSDIWCFYFILYHIETKVKRVINSWCSVLGMFIKPLKTLNL